MAMDLAGIDVGATGARCGLLDFKGNLIASEELEHSSSYPKPGWVEQDLDEMLALTMEACKASISKRKTI